MGIPVAYNIGALVSSLKTRPLAYQLNLIAGIIGILVLVITFIGAARTPDLTGVASPGDQATPAQLRTEAASVRAEVEKLAADLKSIQTDLRDVAALPKDAKLALAQQQMQKAIKDLTERQERLEQIIVSNPAKALELSLLQRDLENVKATQQASLTAVKEAVDHIAALTMWALAGMALSIMLLTVGNFLKGKE